MFLLGKESKRSYTDNDMITTTAVAAVVLAVSCCTTMVVVVARRTLQQQQKQKYNDRRKTKSCCNDDDDDTDNCNKKPIYMDYNGTTPIYSFVYESMIPYLTKYYGNPSSSHQYGTVPSQAIQYARYQILHILLQCPNVESSSCLVVPPPLLSSSSSSSSSSLLKPNTVAAKDDVATSSSSSSTSVTTTSASTTAAAITATTRITPLSSCIFTSCGTEADNFMISLALQLWHLRNNNTNTKTTTKNDIDPSQQQQQVIIPHIITTNIEHPAIDLCLQMYEQQKKCIVIRVPVQPNTGRIDIFTMIQAIQQYQSTIALVTMMLANNETGVIQPVKEISSYIRSHRHMDHILFGTDVAQATGKISITIHDLGDPDFIIIVGHKFGAPKGIGCFYIRPGCIPSNCVLDNNNIQTSLSQQQQQRVYGMLIGGGQEYHWRGGTSNVPYIVGLGVAAEYAQQNLIPNAYHMECMRTRLIQQLQSLLGIHNIRIHGPTDPQQRLPNTLSIGFGNGIDSSILLHDLRNTVAASAGAACHSTGGGKISSILRAMQIPEDWARGTIRLSLGPMTTSDEVDRAATHLAHAVRRQWDSNKK